MSIPLQASTPLVGIDPLKTQKRPHPFRPPEMTPERFRHMMPILLKLRPDLSRSTLAMAILWPGRRSHGKQQRGNPGAGLCRPAPVHKTVTYRATYVPGGFNVERNKRRAEKQAVYAHELPASTIEAIESAQMDARHDHLNALVGQGAA